MYSEVIHGLARALNNDSRTEAVLHDPCGPCHDPRSSSHDPASSVSLTRVKNYYNVIVCCPEVYSIQQAWTGSIPKPGTLPHLRSGSLPTAFRRHRRRLRWSIFSLGGWASWWGFRSVGLMPRICSSSLHIFELAEVIFAAGTYIFVGSSRWCGNSREAVFRVGGGEVDSRYGRRI